MQDYYNGSYSQEPRYTATINYQSNLKQLKDILYNECLLSQFNLENLGIDYLKDYDMTVTLDLYDNVITFINNSYIHINDSILEDDNKRFLFGKSLYEIFFIDIPTEDIREFVNHIDKDLKDLRNIIVNYYITKTKRYESLRSINVVNKEIDYNIFKNSIASSLFDTDLTDFKNKYLTVLFGRI